MSDSDELLIVMHCRFCGKWSVEDVSEALREQGVHSESGSPADRTSGE
jgi:hypothetical protein